jgi:hypothetical protein
LITILELSAIFLISPFLPAFLDEPNVFLLLLKIYLVVYMVWLPVSAQLDARSRYQNYKQIKDQLYFNGFQHRIIKPVLKSRCQRDAAGVAAKELGFDQLCNEYYHFNGFRWYHLLPTWIFKTPQYLFSRYFFRTTFFAPTYRSGVDYRKVLNEKMPAGPLILHHEKAV